MHSDSTRVCQVLLNLLSNAFKFTERGTVVLDLERDAENEDDWLMVKVIDNGSGMSEEQMAQLFQEFMPTDSPTTRHHGGAGLGLAISRRLCRLLGGDIQVKSKLGTGTTFTVRLPLMAPEASQPA
jgi:signal transduction histidine kinase